MAAGTEYLLWDHDGVLVDTERWYFEATRSVLEECDIELTVETYLDRMASGRSSWELARARGMSQSLIDARRRERDAL